MTEIDSTTMVMLVLITVFIGIAVLIAVVRFFDNFSRELKYLETEISRTTGMEQKYWIDQKKRLWLSLIPFVKY